MGWQELSDKEELMKEILAKTEEEPVRNEAVIFFKTFCRKLGSFFLGFGICCNSFSAETILSYVNTKIFVIFKF